MLLILTRFFVLACHMVGFICLRIGRQLPAKKDRSFPTKISKKENVR